MTTLKYYTYPNETNVIPKKAVIFLHGWGSNGQDLISLAPYFEPALGDDVLYISPDALELCDINPMGFQWFSLNDRDPKVMGAGAQSTFPIVDGFIKEIIETHAIKPENIILVGFSQGTMTGLNYIVNTSYKLAGMVGLSGAFIETGTTPKHTIPVTLIHGKQDDVVPFTSMAIASDILSKKGFTVETHAVDNLGHSIDETVFTHATNFMRDKFIKS